MRHRLLIFAVMLSLFSAHAAYALEPAAPVKPLAHQDLIKQISQAKGKVVLVNFWATWCQPCRMEIPELMRLRASYGEDKLVMIGVSLDQDPDMLAAFTAKTGFNYPIYVAKPDLALGFNVRGIPKTLVYSQDGEQILNHDGYIPEAMLRDLMAKLLGG